MRGDQIGQRNGIVFSGQLAQRCRDKEPGEDDTQQATENGPDFQETNRQGGTGQSDQQPGRFTAGALGKGNGSGTQFAIRYDKIRLGFIC